MKQLAGDPAAAVNDTKHPHSAVGLRAPVDHDVAGNDADANIRANFGAWRAGVGEVRQVVIELFERSVVPCGDAVSCLGLKISDDPSSVRVGGRCDDDARR